MTNVAVLQLVSSANLASNLSAIESLLSRCQHKKIELVVLPENCFFMGMHEQDKWAIAEQYNKGLIQETLAKWALKYNLWIVAGTLPVKGRQQKVRSSCLVFDSQGKIAARYDKIHLFDVIISDTELYQESNSIEAGNKITIVDTPAGRLGLSICYDLRFPELYRQMALNGAEIFAIPSAFTDATGVMHWEILLRARAIENLSYILAANQGGLHANGRQTYGHSMIIAPWGNILAEAKEGIDLVRATIDLEQQAVQRNQFPCLNHHKLSNKVSFYE